MYAVLFNPNFSAQCNKIQPSVHLLDIVGLGKTQQQHNVESARCNKSQQLNQ